MSLCSNTAVLRRIVEEYPKKNNGLLYKRRILKIAWMYAITELELTAEDGRKIAYPALYQLYAQADEDTELTVTARLYDPLQYLGGLEQNDLIVKTNLFSDLQGK